MSVDDLAGRIVVRHREAGLLRLELPAELCYPEAAAAIEQGLRAQAGVFRVGMDSADRRLSIRFEPRDCTVAELARRLKGLLGNLPAPAPTPLAAEPHANTEPPHSDAEALAGRAAASLHDAGERVRSFAEQARLRVRAALGALRTPAAAEGSLAAKLQPVIASALTEKAVVNFINDVVMFYLIKAHWELISSRWLKDPIRYRNAWLTVFYLVFLLVRYRKQSSAKP